jgi:hypothetical protein
MLPAIGVHRPAQRRRARAPSITTIDRLRLKALPPKWKAVIAAVTRRHKSPIPGHPRAKVEYRCDICNRNTHASVYRGCQKGVDVARIRPSEHDCHARDLSALVDLVSHGCEEVGTGRKQRVEVGRGSDMTPSLPQPDMQVRCVPVSQNQPSTADECLPQSGVTGSIGSRNARCSSQYTVR